MYMFLDYFKVMFKTLILLLSIQFNYFHLRTELNVIPQPLNKHLLTNQ